MVEAVNYVDQLRLLDPDAAWTARWHFHADMNFDGTITISDVWLWTQWVFFAPGDGVLLAAMKWAKPVAAFMEITPANLFGWSSAILSIMIWSMVPSLYRN